MYKSDIQRIEDGIIPFVLETLMVTHVREFPEREEGYRDALRLIREDIKIELNTDKLLRRAARIERKLLRFWESNNCEIRKGYMIISYLAAALDEQDAVVLGENTRSVLKEINDIITSAYDNKDILKQDKSAAKQVPKVLAILQEEGLF